MRIVQVTSSPEGIGGAEQVLAEICKLGLATGRSVSVVNIAPQENTALSRLVLNARVQTVESPMSAAGIVRALPTLRRILNAQEPDLIHAHLPLASGLVALTRRRQSRVMTHHHGELYSVHNRRLLVRVEKVVARRYEAVVAPSKAVAGYLSERVAVPTERIVTIRNGWSGQPEPPRRGGTNLRLVCVANLRPEKGHITLLKSLAKLRARLPVELILVGEGTERPRLEGALRQLDLVGAVHFAGATADPWRLLAEADLFVLASTSETLGIAILEAAAAGLPTVATSVGGIPEIVRDGETGILVPPNSPERFAEAVEALLGNEKLRLQMGRAAQERARGHRADRMAASYWRLYEELVDRASA